MTYTYVFLVQKDLKLSLNMGDQLEQPLPLTASANEVSRYTSRVTSQWDTALLSLSANEGVLNFIYESTRRAPLWANYITSGVRIQVLKINFKNFKLAKTS